MENSKLEKAAKAYANTVEIVLPIHSTLGDAEPLKQSIRRALETAFTTGANQGAYIIQEMDKAVLDASISFNRIKSKEYTMEDVNKLRDAFINYNAITGELLTIPEINKPLGFYGEVGEAIPKSDPKEFKTYVSAVPSSSEIDPASEETDQAPDEPKKKRKPFTGW